MNEAMQVVVSTTTKTVAASAGQGGGSKTITHRYEFLESAHPFPPAIARQAVVRRSSPWFLSAAAKRRQGDVLADKVVCEDLCWQH